MVRSIVVISGDRGSKTFKTRLFSELKATQKFSKNKILIFRKGINTIMFLIRFPFYYYFFINLVHFCELVDWVYYRL